MSVIVRDGLTSPALMSGRTSVQRKIMDPQVASASEPKTVLSLPAEVREKIWDYALGDPNSAVGCRGNCYDTNSILARLFYQTPWDHDHLVRLHNHRSNQCWGQQSLTQLLRVNKTVYNESAYVLYALSDFYLDFNWSSSVPLAVVRRFFKTLRPSCANAIRTFTISKLIYLTDANEIHANALIRANAPALQRVNVFLTASGSNEVKYSVI